ncbi:TauD/TfdA family dioxygenase [Amycolatopsis sp. NPDC004079]|uniref:TauD/TfdA family dioxygenase n=1 Tax=Amycolatopsis sp. NPDC004079 TaxID=3154549 RepID=UPI0033BAF123
MTQALSESLVTLGACTGRLDGTEHTKVVVYEPSGRGLDVEDWAARFRPELMRSLRTQGAVLVRGAVDSPELLHAVGARIGGELLSYTERSTPRTQVSSRVYTSTEYPRNQTIAQHNESAYSDGYPHWLFFACGKAAETGGETPLADSRAVLDRLPAGLVTRFREKGVLYTRTFREGMGLTWQESFQTEDRQTVEAYCRAHGIECAWTGEGLRTRHRRPALIADPVSGREIWFNQAHLFHTSNLPAATRAALAELFDEEDMPRGARYGDGAAIPDGDMELVREAYDETMHVFPWAEGDLLMVNNLLVSHGRKPYTGDREILVAMAGKGGDGDAG